MKKIYDEYSVMSAVAILHILKTRGLLPQALALIDEETYKINIKKCMLDDGSVIIEELQ